MSSACSRPGAACRTMFTRPPFTNADSWLSWDTTPCRCDRRTGCRDASAVRRVPGSRRAGTRCRSGLTHKSDTTLWAHRRIDRYVIASCRDATAAAAPPRLQFWPSSVRYPPPRVQVSSRSRARCSRLQGSSAGFAAAHSLYSRPTVMSVGVMRLVMEMVGSQPI